MFKKFMEILFGCIILLNNTVTKILIYYKTMKNHCSYIKKKLFLVLLVLATSFYIPMFKNRILAIGKWFSFSHFYEFYAISDNSFASLLPIFRSMLKFSVKEKWCCANTRNAISQWFAVNWIITWAIIVCIKH